MAEIDPVQLSRALAEIPLFREIQRVLQSSSGPVNWEIARQIADAVSGAGEGVGQPTAEDQARFEESCRIAELQISSKTAWGPGNVVPSVSVVGRRLWASSNITGFRPLVDKLATRLGLQMMPGGGPAGLGSLLGALGPFVMGAQVGFLIGHLAREALGDHWLALPRNPIDNLSFVHPNIEETAQQLDLQRQEFEIYVCIHESSHQLILETVPWSVSHLTNMVHSYIDALQIDPAALMEKLQGFQEGEDMSTVIERPEDLLPLLIDPSAQAVTSQIQAFMSVIEGQSEWIIERATSELLPSYEKIREGLSRSRAERSSSDRLLEKFLGIDIRPEQHRSGARFISAVAEAGKTDVLWSGPSSLPLLEEIREPARWLSRVAFG